MLLKKNVKRASRQYKIINFHDNQFLNAMDKLKAISCGNSDHFDKIYTYSNERVDDYLSAFDLKGKRVFTVGSSGDQVLVALLHGAKEVVCMDVNPFSKYFYALKTASIKNLSFEQTNKLLATDREILKLDYFSEVRKFLSPTVRRFWDKVFLKNVDRFLKSESCGDFTQIFDDKKRYAEMKKILNSAPRVKFICGDLREVDKHLQGMGKFDLALLSNTSDYIDSTSNYFYKGKLQNVKFKEVIKQLNPHLTPKASVQVSYFWDHKQYKYEQAKKTFGSENLSIVSTHPCGGAIFYQPVKAELEN